MDEIELVRRCQRRDYAAFEALYGLTAGRAVRTAHLILRSRAEAEDAVQEAFIQVWRRIETLREAGSFRPWFYRILLNAARRLGKKEHGLATVPLDLRDHDRADDHSRRPEEHAEYGEELRELRAALATLPDSHRVPLVLRYYSKLSDAEIAEAMEIPMGTVKSRLHNARQTLQEMLTRHGGAAPHGKERPSHG